MALIIIWHIIHFLKKYPVISMKVGTLFNSLLNPHGLEQCLSQCICSAYMMINTPVQNMLLEKSSSMSFAKSIFSYIYISYNYIYLCIHTYTHTHTYTHQVALVVKSLPANMLDLRDSGSILGLGRSPGEGHGNPLQYSCLENPHRQRSLMGYGP